MAITQAQAANLTTNMLLRGVIETIVTESAVLNYLPFVDVIGAALQIPQETTMATAQYSAVGGTWTEGTPVYSGPTETLKILGGDADVDQFLERTFSSVDDIEAEVIHGKARAVAYQFNSSFFSGDTGSDANSFDGIDKRIAALTLAMMDQLIDAVKPGRPDALFMPRRSRRNLNALRRAAGNVLQADLDQFGRMVLWYDGIPVEIDDNIPDTKTVGTSGAVCSTIYAVKFGYGLGVIGLQNGGIMVDRIGELETKDARRTRIKWYVSINITNPIGAARLIGVNGN